MDLYGQEPEARLLAAFVSRLENTAVIDVGAERGAFAEEMLQAGSDPFYAVEPEPGNASLLRERFAEDARVVVMEYALGERDESLDLRLSVDPAGEPLSFGHTVLSVPDADEIAWAGTVSVEGRSLASLVNAGEIPRRVGILKIDTEGSDLAVLAGMGELDCDIVMVEHWQDLPHSLGPCPWSTDDLASLLRPRGFTHFAFVVHRGPFTLLQWDDGETPSGSMGNLVFVHDRVLGLVLPDLVACASSLAEHVTGQAESYVTAADERRSLIDDLDRECRRRLELIEQLQVEYDRRLAEITELQLERAAQGAENKALRRELALRLELIERLNGECERLREATGEPVPPGS